MSTERDADQQQAVLAQLAEQLRNAAEVLEWARNNAHWRQLPTLTWEWLRDATATARGLAAGLDEAGPAFASPTRPSRGHGTRPAGTGRAAPTPPPPPAQQPTRRH
ncbi:hypothetical protein [Streptomyces caeruleatus]|uniref:Uncharacterized protein n=1 Tax=Streptomyces caeruleatus TaxID=661399 RepID=A0A101U5G2_9ACTN|nr:hypothetical protein [Streptomyces caeruleatus]KUO04630.1 hypothetical protein AQJ67_10540 [Streptomyces caeruleatus]